MKNLLEAYPHAEYAVNLQRGRYMHIQTGLLEVVVPYTKRGFVELVVNGMTPIIIPLSEACAVSVGELVTTYSTDAGHVVQVQVGDRMYNTSMEP